MDNSKLPETYKELVSQFHDLVKISARHALDRDSIQQIMLSFLIVVSSAKLYPESHQYKELADTAVDILIKIKENETSTRLANEQQPGQ